MDLPNKPLNDDKIPSIPLELIEMTSIDSVLWWIWLERIWAETLCFFVTLYFFYKIVSQLSKDRSQWNWMHFLFWASNIILYVIAIGYNIYYELIYDDNERNKYAAYFRPIEYARGTSALVAFIGIVLWEFWAMAECKTESELSKI